MIFKKPLVIWLGNEGGSETGDLLGCILPHKRAILVPQTRRFFATIAGSYLKPLPSVSMSSADCNALRDWASSYGAAVRQRTVRQDCQETTMAKHGTLAEFIYQRCQRKIIRKKTRVTPSLMKAAMKMLKIMVGKNRFFKERSEARPRFSWERRLDLGELLDLSIVCSTDHRNAVAGS